MVDFFPSCNVAHVLRTYINTGTHAFFDTYRYMQQCILSCIIFGCGQTPCSSKTVLKYWASQMSDQIGFVQILTPSMFILQIASLTSLYNSGFVTLYESVMYVFILLCVCVFMQTPISAWPGSSRTRYRILVSLIRYIRTYVRR